MHNYMHIQNASHYVAECLICKVLYCEQNVFKLMLKYSHLEQNSKNWAVCVCV